MIRKGKLVLWALPAAAAVAAAGFAYDRHYRARLWPAELQRTLLGSEIARRDAQIDREGSSAYGEGLFRWRYRIDPSDPRLKPFCAEAPAPQACRFTRSRRIAEGVEISVSYSGGVMILEEIWS